MKTLFDYFRKKNTLIFEQQRFDSSNTIVIDKDLQEDLDKNGFVKIKLLTDKQVSEIIKFYESMPNSKRNDFGFHVSLDIEKKEIITIISDFIKQKISQEIDKYIKNYQLISPRFAVKEANDNSLVPPHQDWSFVDETKFQSYNLWIAITPSNNNNGTLGFLKGSHNILHNIRATPLPIFKVPFDEYAYELIDKLEYVELEAGEALLFNSRIIHASKPNTTKYARINIAIEITNKDAQLVHYNLQPDHKTINEYYIDNTFFHNYSNAKLTAFFHQKKGIEKYKLNRKFKYSQEKISKKQLLSIL